MENDFKQGAITFEKPYVIKPDGVYFRETTLGIKFTRSFPISTYIAAKEALDAAYQRGYEEAASELLNPTK